MLYKKLLSFVIFSILMSASIEAVQLENWRMPYYNTASRMDKFLSSPSGMFWDDLSEPVDRQMSIDKSLWPDSLKTSTNHWNLEPDILYTTRNTNDYFGKNNAFHIAALNDIKFNNFLVRQVLDVDSRYMADTAYPWMKQRFAAGRISEAFIQYGFNHGFVRYGRMNRNWGPFLDRSLILSNNAYSFDALEFGLHSSMFEFRHLFAALPQSTIGYDADVNNASRYFTAHSLNFMIGKYGSIGVSESVLFTRDKSQFDFQYINPIAIYSVINTNGEGIGNLMLAFQWDIHPIIDNVAIKGQVMIDDIQIDNKAAGDQEPNHWAGDFGVFVNNVIPGVLPHVFSLEYRYCSRWLYTVADANTDAGERYTYLQKSLGYPSNDADSLNLSFTLLGKNYWVGNAGLFYSRQGENRITTRWGNGGGFGYRIEKQIPSGIVEESYGLTTEVRGYYKNFASAFLSLSNRWVKNKRNVQSDVQYDPVISLTLQTHFSNLFVKIPK